MRVLIADDQANVRSALRLILSQDAGMKVVGEVSSRDDLIASVRMATPDLVLLEWELINAEPGGPISALREAFPGLKIVAMSGRPESRPDALAAGVDGFISKVDPPNRLGAILHSIKQAGSEDAQPGDRVRKESRGTGFEAS
jgi:two-component system response regulator DesR